MVQKYQQAYFENPAVWDAQAWRERKTDLERAKIASAWLPGDVHIVLDVGCGNGVFTNLPAKRQFKAGMDLSRVALQNVTTPVIQADASRIPFANGVFEACVCMEMLEHLHDASFQTALEELGRVAGEYILVSVPYNENLEYNRVTCPVCRHNFHRYYHARGFRRPEFDRLFGADWQLERLEGIIPAEEKALPTLWHLVRRYNHRQGMNFPPGAICPNCGYSREPEVGQSEQTQSRGIALFRHLGKLWPHRRVYTWWMALYRTAG